MSNRRAPQMKRIGPATTVSPAAKYSNANAGSISDISNGAMFCTVDNVPGQAPELVKGSSHNTKYLGIDSPQELPLVRCVEFREYCFFHFVARGVTTSTAGVISSRSHSRPSPRLDRCNQRCPHSRNGGIRPYNRCCFWFWQHTSRNQGIRFL